ncbi:MAG TPA: alpha/beta hydrolase [Saprospiraceae bacterium]|nr:alpha/beta hydrolase [Saprospiraceae bacterium]HMP23866.1 alpha/beta hydrolase [Saprospiraceae bacterium]
MKFTTFRNRKIAYSVQGKGRPIVLVHGFGEDSFVWKDYYPYFTEAGYSVLTLDLPGFGASELVDNLSIEAMAEVIHAVAEEANLQKFLLVGHSMGGYASLAFAKKHPERLYGLGLFHSHPYADSEEKKEGRLRSIEVVKAKGTPLFVKQFIPNLFAPKFAQSHTFLLDKLIHRAARFRDESVIAALEAMRTRPDQSEVLRQFPLPVLFILGQEDQAIPKDAAMEQITLTDSASILLLEEVAHMGMFEATRKTQQAIAQFAEFCINLAQTA